MDYHLPHTQSFSRRWVDGEVRNNEKFEFKRGCSRKRWTPNRIWNATKCSRSRIEAKRVTIHGHFVDLCGVILFNVAKNSDIVSLYKIDGNTFPSKTSTSTNAMNVQFTTVWEIVVDHQWYLMDINSATKHVRWNQNSTKKGGFLQQFKHRMVRNPSPALQRIWHLVLSTVGVGGPSRRLAVIKTPSKTLAIYLRRFTPFSMWFAGFFCWETRLLHSHSGWFSHHPSGRPGAIPLGDYYREIQKKIVEDRTHKNFAKLCVNKRRRVNWQIEYEGWKLVSQANFWVELDFSVHFLDTLAVQQLNVGSVWNKF